MGEEEGAEKRGATAKGSLHISCTCDTDLVRPGDGSDSGGGRVTRGLWLMAMGALLVAAGAHYALPSNRVSPLDGIPLDPHQVSEGGCEWGCV